VYIYIYPDPFAFIIWKRVVRIFYKIKKSTVPHWLGKTEISDGVGD